MEPLDLGVSRGVPRSPRIVHCTDWANNYLDPLAAFLKPGYGISLLSCHTKETPFQPKSPTLPTTSQLSH